MAYKYKYQFNEQRTYGVEIECLANSIDDRRAIEQEIAAAGIAVRDIEAYEHTHNPHGTWIMKVDGSITRPNGTPLESYPDSLRKLEIVTPILKGKDDLEKLRKVIEIMARHATVNKSCGVHVHHGVSDLNGKQFKNLYNVYSVNKPVIDYLVAPSRRNAYYAMPLKAKKRREFQPQSVARLEGRYRVINFDSYAIRGTVEFRQHQGSLDAEKIIAWVVFTQAIVEFGVNCKASRLVASDQFQPRRTPIQHLAWRVGILRTGRTWEADIYRKLEATYTRFWNDEHPAAIPAPAEPVALA